MANRSSSITVSMLVDVNARVDKAKTAIKSLESMLGSFNLGEGITKSLNSTFSKLDKEFVNFQALSNKELFNAKDLAQVEKSFDNIMDLINTLNVQTKNIKGIDIEKLIPTDFLNQSKGIRQELKGLIKEWGAAQNELSKSQEGKRKEIEALEKQLNSQVQIMARAAEAEKKYQKAIERSGKADQGVKDISDQINKKKEQLKLLEKESQFYQDGRSGKFKNKKDQSDQQRFEAMTSQSQSARTRSIKSIQQEIDVLEQQKKILEETAKLEKTNLTSARKKYSDTQGQLEGLLPEEETAKIQQRIQSLKQELSSLTINFDNSKIQKVRQELAALAGIELSEVPSDLQELNTYLSSLNTDKITELQVRLGNLEAPIDDMKGSFEGIPEVFNEVASNIEIAEQASQDLDRIRYRFMEFFSVFSAVNLVKRAVRSAYQSVTELDKAMTETAVVTDFTVSDMWEKLPEYTKMANKLGATTQGAYETSTLYYQQGLNTAQVMAISTETMKMARIAGMEYADATNMMTAALRGFNMEINEQSATRVNDVYSELAAITAADTNQIATAMTKTASIAASANMEFESTAAFLSQIIETTQEAPETAGTALKTIIARFTEVKKLYSQGDLLGTDEEGEAIDVNKIQTALRSVGISMTEFFRGEEGLDDVLLRLAEKWDTLDLTTQRYIATTAAGSRQQSRFLAMMSDYDRTMELVGAANDSAGASQEQFDKTLESLESKINNLTNAWQAFTMSLANDGLIKGAVDVLTSLLNVINDLTGLFGEGSGIAKLLFGAGLFKVGSGLAGGLGSMFKAVQAGKTGIDLGNAFQIGAGKALGFGTIKLEGGNNLGKEIGRSIIKPWKQATWVPWNRKQRKNTPLNEKQFDELYFQEQKEIIKKESELIDKKQKERNAARGQKRKDISDEIRRAQTRKNAAENTITAGRTTEDYSKAKTEALNKATEVQAYNLQTGAQAAIALAGAAAFIGNAFEKAGMEKAAEATNAIASGATAAAVGLNVATTATKIFGATAGTALGWISVALGALISVFKIVDAVTESSEEKIERLTLETQNAKIAADEAHNSYKEFLSGTSQHNELLQELESLIEGTTAFKEAIREANNQALQLINTYDIASTQWYFDDQGVIRFSTGTTEEIAKKQERTADVLSRGATVTSVSNDKAKIREDVKNVYGNEWSGYIEKIISSGTEEEIQKRITSLDMLTEEDVTQWVNFQTGRNFSGIDYTKFDTLTDAYNLLSFVNSDPSVMLGIFNSIQRTGGFSAYAEAMSSDRYKTAALPFAQSLGYDTSSLVWDILEEDFYDMIEPAFSRTTILDKTGKEWSITDYANHFKDLDEMLLEVGDYLTEGGLDLSLITSKEQAADAILQVQRERFANAALENWNSYELTVESLKGVSTAAELKRTTEGKLAPLQNKITKVYNDWAKSLGETTVEAISKSLNPEEFYEANKLYERMSGFSEELATQMAYSLAQGNLNYQNIKFLDEFNYEIGNDFLIARQFSQWSKMQGTEYSKILSNLTLQQVDAKEIFDALSGDENFIELQKELLAEFSTTGQISSVAIQEAAEEGSLLADALETGIINAQGLATSLEMVKRGDVSELTSSLLEANSAAGRLQSTIAKAFSYIDNFEPGRSQREFADFTKTGGEAITKALSEGRWFDTQLESYYKALFGDQAWQDYVRTITEGSDKGLKGRALQEFLVNSTVTGDEIRAATSLQQYGDMRGYVQYLYGQDGMQQAFANAGITVGKEGLVTISETTTLDQIEQLFNLTSTPEGIRDMLIGEWTSMGSGNLYQQWKSQDVKKGVQSFIDATTGGNADQLLAFFKENAEILTNTFPQVQTADDFIDYINRRSQVTYQKSEQFNLNAEDWYKQNKESLSFASDEEINIDIDKATKQLQGFGKTGKDAFEIIKAAAIDTKKPVEYLNQKFEITKDMSFEQYQSKLEELSQEHYGNTIGRGIAQALIEGDVEISPTLDTSDAAANWKSFVSGLTASIPVNLTAGEDGSVTLTLGSFSVGKIGAPQNMLPGFAKGRRNYQGPALTGEDGPELVVGQHGAYLTGIQGPEFQYIYKDDAIYTASETKKILSKNSMPGFEGGTSGNPKISVIYTDDLADITSIVSGSGSGGGSKKGGDWDNPYDELYNLTEKINEALRDREKLEREYDHLLENRNASYTDLIRNTLDSMANLRKEIALQQALQAGRARQLQNIGQYTYRDKDKKEKTFAESGVMQYAQYDSATGLLEIDWEGIEAVTDENKGAAIEAYISKLEELVEQYEETEETIADMEDTLEEIRDRGKEQYLEFEDRIYEALVEREQKIIDEYEDASNTINDSNSRILDGLRESIDLSRQIRDNTKTEEDIADKEARLAYLRRDTSGANQLEIQQLEEELKEMRQSYQDSLVDQELDRLNQVNETANEQRERQIEIANAQLEWLEQSGYFWDETYALLKGAFNEDGTLNNNSALVNLLKETDGFKGMSEFGSYDWIVKLIQEFNEAESGYSSWMLDKAEDQGYIEGTSVGKLTYDRESGKWTGEDGKEYTAAWNEKKNSWDVKEVKANASTKPGFETGAGNNTAGIGGGRVSWKTEWVKDSIGHARRQIKYVDGKKVGESLEPRQLHLFDGLKCIICGYIKKKTSSLRGYDSLERYTTGGLNTRTGPAILDGTPSRPEYVLNAEQTGAFLQLADILPALMSNNSVSTSTSSGDNYFDININVDSISSDYDVDRLTERIKQNIYEDGAYRNVNVINRLR